MGDREIIERTLKVAKGIGKVIVAACTKEQKSKETDYPAGRHGTFTLSLVEGLRGKATNADGEVTASTLYDYVAKRVESEWHDQRPVMVSHMEGVIVLMHYTDRVPGSVSSPGPGGGDGGGTCESSGDWVMVGNLLLPAITVTVQGTKMPRANWDVIRNFSLPTPPQPLLDGCWCSRTETYAALAIYCCQS